MNSPKGSSMVLKLTFPEDCWYNIIGVTISLPLFLKNPSGVLVKGEGKEEPE